MKRYWMEGGRVRTNGWQWSTDGPMGRWHDHRFVCRYDFYHLLGASDEGQ